MDTPHCVHVLMHVYDNVTTLQQHLELGFKCSLSSEGGVYSRFLRETVVASCKTGVHDKSVAPGGSCSPPTSVSAALRSISAASGEEHVPRELVQHFLQTNEAHFQQIVDDLARSMDPSAGCSEMVILYKLLRTCSLFTFTGNHCVIQRTGTEYKT